MQELVDYRPPLTSAAPDPLDEVRAMAASIPPGTEGDTVLEAASDAGRAYREDMDANRWKLGDLANLLQDRYPNFEDSYGERVIASFARDIGARKRTVYEYGETARFYPDSARRALSSMYPSIVYSHYRAAMRLTTHAERRQDPDGALARALEFLMECATQGWTADQADRESKKRKSTDEAGPLFDQVLQAQLHEGGFYFWLGAVKGMTSGKSYRVTVQEVDR